ncbi:MAG: hypothetical protein ACKVS5_10595 [Parvularculaceae bacterium]
MTRALEASVQRLAGALDALETRLDARLGDLAAQSDALDAARTKAGVAKAQAAAAAEDLNDAICDLKALIKETGG